LKLRNSRKNVTIDIQEANGDGKKKGSLVNEYNPDIDFLNNKNISNMNQMNKSQ